MLQLLFLPHPHINSLNSQLLDYSYKHTDKLWQLSFLRTLPLTLHLPPPPHFSFPFTVNNATFQTYSNYTHMTLLYTIPFTNVANNLHVAKIKSILYPYLIRISNNLWHIWAFFLLKTLSSSESGDTILFFPGSSSSVFFAESSSFTSL